MTVADNINALIRIIHNFLEGLEHTHIKPFLADWPSPESTTHAVLPCRLPVLSCLTALVEAAGKETAILVNRLASLANHMAWGQTYSLQDVSSDFLEKYGWTELIGQRGPITSNRMACGFLLLGSQVEYPRHCHEAEEVYVPLTLQTFWQQGKQEWICRVPGVPIYHASWRSHAMRTETTPLLALYLWRGSNLVQKSLFES
jgi:Dimethlysulfonioproprionate lyase